MIASGSVQTVGGFGPVRQRLVALDAARGAALVAMAFYHLFYDLQLFGHLPRGTMQSAPWPQVASLIAGSFLALSGVSLALAHGRGIRWRAFARRFAILVAAAGLVSVTTWLAFPGRFVHFGILHAIAASSLLGLAFLRLPGVLVLGLAAIVLIVPQVFQHDMFNTPWLWWLGLSEIRPPSMDYEPMFPWFAPFLVGLALAGRLVPWLEGATRSTGSGAMRRLAWLGRHSLAVYLIHQPVLMGLVWAVAPLSP